MKRLTIICGLFLAVAFSTAAQDMPRVELFGGYTYARIFNTNSDTSNANGIAGDIAFFPTKWLGIVGDFGGAWSTGFTNTAGNFVSASTTSVHYMGGPRLRFGNSRFTPYVQFLVGGVHRSQVMTGGSEGELIASPENSFAYTANGGVDLKLSHHFSVRLFQAGYLHTQFTPNQLGTGASNSQNDFTFATGIVIH
jgi:opacity protein-like surface antigen